MRSIIGIAAAASSVLLLCCCFTAPLGAREYKCVEPTLSLRLYPEGQDVDKGILENGTPVTLGPGVSNGLTGEPEVKENGNTSNVGNDARIDVYLPRKCNGQMIVVCPGGGYRLLSMYNEGSRVADWCVKHGIACCVVMYRLPNSHDTVPLRDVQNAFRYCRAHCQEWGVKQIGVMGFSAGGHLAATASNLWTDEVTRPDFSVLVYPVISFRLPTHDGTRKHLTGGKERYWDYYSMEKQVSTHTPKTLLCVSADDKTVPVINSVAYYQRLLECRVPSELHVYTDGGHGWGFTTVENTGSDRLGERQRGEFFATLERWLEDRRNEIN